MVRCAVRGGTKLQQNFTALYRQGQGHLVAESVVAAA